MQPLERNMRYTSLLSRISLLTLSAPAFAHGNHAAYPGDQVLHLLAHHWPLIVVASVLALVPSLLRKIRSLRGRSGFPS